MNKSIYKIIIALIIIIAIVLIAFFYKNIANFFQIYFLKACEFIGII